MSIAENLENHHKLVALEITKIDDTICSTPSIPMEQLVKHRNRRVEYQEVGKFINYLMHVNNQQTGAEPEAGKIITMP